MTRSFPSPKNTHFWFRAIFIMLIWKKKLFLSFMRSGDFDQNTYNHLDTQGIPEVVPAIMRRKHFLSSSPLFFLLVFLPKPGMVSNFYYLFVECPSII